jgi:Secretion system C-terminal sorting domain
LNPKVEAMKTFLPARKNAVKTLLTGALLTATMLIKAQSGQSVPELVFKNPIRESGTAGSDGTVYRFYDVGNNIDALVTIAGRSSSLVKLTTIDLASTGYDNAFQPQISYNNGSASRNLNWWMDFDIRFVNKGTSASATVNTFNLTALDVDGDGSRLNEYVSFYSAASYTLESNSSLKVKTIVDLILGLTTQGKQFDGPTNAYNGVDVNATNIMTTQTYINNSSFRMRAGAATGSSSSSSADRMYSFWFKSFNYNIPVQVTLPVKLVSFSATLDDDKVDLKWTTSSEKEVSHFSIEKSSDGQHFSQAGIVFAIGNSSEIITYSFPDKNINLNSTGIIYYRLRSIDMDGSSELSAVRMITPGSQNKQGAVILTYPNPVTNDLHITIPKNWQGRKVTYELLDNNGRATKRKTVASASQTESMPVANLGRGFYIARVTCNDESAHQKVIKR